MTRRNWPSEDPETWEVGVAPERRWGERGATDVQDNLGSRSKRIMKTHTIKGFQSSQTTAGSMKIKMCFSGSRHHKAPLLS